MTFDSVKNIGISLLASAGFITAIIGLSAQKTLFSLFSGLQIALAQPLKLVTSLLLKMNQVWLKKLLSHMSP